MKIQETRLLTEKLAININASNHNPRRKLQFHRCKMTDGGKPKHIPSISNPKAQEIIDQGFNLAGNTTWGNDSGCIIDVFDLDDKLHFLTPELKESAFIYAINKIAISGILVNSTNYSGFHLICKTNQITSWKYNNSSYNSARNSRTKFNQTRHTIAQILTANVQEFLVNTGITTNIACRIKVEHLGQPAIYNPEQKYYDLGTNFKIPNEFELEQLIQLLPTLFVNCALIAANNCKDIEKIIPEPKYENFGYEIVNGDDEKLPEEEIDTEFAEAVAKLQEQNDSPAKTHRSNADLILKKKHTTSQAVDFSKKYEDDKARVRRQLNDYLVFDKDNNRSIQAGNWIPKKENPENLKVNKYLKMSQDELVDFIVALRGYQEQQDKRTDEFKNTSNLNGALAFGEYLEKEALISTKMSADEQRGSINYKKMSYARKVAISLGLLLVVKPVETKNGLDIYYTAPIGEVKGKSPKLMVNRGDFDVLDIIKKSPCILADHDFDIHALIRFKPSNSNSFYIEKTNDASLVSDYYPEFEIST